MNNIFKTAFGKLKKKAKKIKSDVAALYLAYKRKDVPIYAKIAAAVVVGYTLSPIDFIPDFIPVLGYLDDLILLPLGIMLAVKLIPKEIMEECRKQAEDLFKQGKPKILIAAFIIVLVWVSIFGFIIYKILN